MCDALDGRRKMADAQVDGGQGKGRGRAGGDKAEDVGQVVRGAIRGVREKTAEGERLLGEEAKEQRRGEGAENSR